MSRFIVNFDDLEEVVEKHLAGLHDQSTHGRGNGKVGHADLSKFDETLNDKDKFFAAAESLRTWSSLPISDEDIKVAFARALFRNVPVDSKDPMFRDSLKELQHSATEYIAKTPTSVLMSPDSLVMMIGEGEFQNLYHDPELKGEYYYGQRSIYEKVTYGYDEGYTDADWRPVYGAVLPTDNSLDPRMTRLYGSVQVVLKDDTKSRTTYTIGDSLDTWQKPTRFGGKFETSLTTVQVGGSALRYRKSQGGNYFESSKWHSKDYIEAQVHDGVKLSDIDKIIFHDGTEKLSPLGVGKLTDFLTEYGIPWEKQP